MSIQSLIRIPNWLGDAVMAAPAVYAFAARQPAGSVALLGIPASLSVYQHAPLPLRLLEYDRRGRHAGALGFTQMAFALRRESFDRGYLLTNSFSSAWLFWAAGIKERIGASIHARRLLLTRAIQFPDTAVHQAQRYFYLLNDTTTEPLVPEIFIQDDERTRARERLVACRNAGRPVIGMAVGAAYGGAKRWPLERYAELARRCVREGKTQVLLFGSIDERESAQSVADAAGTDCVNLAGSTSLRELFALVERCAVLVTNDSGVMHVATAVRTPVVALFGPTDRRDTGPLGDRIHLLDKQIFCAPCRLRECPYSHHACMRNITVDEVMQVIQSWFRCTGIPPQILQSDLNLQRTDITKPEDL